MRSAIRVRAIRVASALFLLLPLLAGCASQAPATATQARPAATAATEATGAGGATTAAGTPAATTVATVTTRPVPQKDGKLVVALDPRLKV